MAFFTTALSFLTHIDTYLGLLFSSLGVYAYGILFLLLFLETGFVVTPFLPGDSLLFATGALAGIGIIHPLIAWFVLLLGAICGDSSNYWIGRTAGTNILHSRLHIVKESHLEKTNAFFETWGGRTIIIGRFLPIVRTFAPFIAGMGQMSYSHFLKFSVGGSFIWVTLLVGAGYLFGSIPFVRDNMSVVIYVIIAVSLLPALYQYFVTRYSKKARG